MTDDDVQPIIIAGLPGIRYEACRGRKTLKAATFIGRATSGWRVAAWSYGTATISIRTRPPPRSAPGTGPPSTPARQQATAPDPDPAAMRESIARTIGLPIEFR